MRLTGSKAGCMNSMSKVRPQHPHSHQCIVVDFTSDHPIVMTGSHNYSTNASQGNDENIVITRD